MDHSGMDMSGMDMGGDATSMSGGMISMKMYMHGTLGGDVLWFRSWQPSSAGATVGVCIGLFLLAILDRYLHALWRACTANWAKGRVGVALPRAQGEEYIVVRDEDDDDGGSARFVPAAALAAAAPVAPAKVPEPTPTAVSSAVDVAVGSCCERKNKEKEADANDKLSIRSGSSFAPAPCQCGCGGECGASSAPVYREVATPPSEPSEKTVGLGAIPLLSSATPVAAAYLPAAARRRLDPKRPGRWSRPFRWGADLPRGLLWAVQTTIHYLLMLTVMTFQLWWIISVIVGAGVGEALFGRFGAR